MTEDEAKTKWCPFAAQTDKGFGSFNRVRYPVLDDDGKPVIDENGWRVLGDALPAGGCQCLGARCMAWRETRITQPNGEIIIHRGHGYCGLVGR